MKTIETDLGLYEIYDNYVIARFSAGVSVGFDDADSIIKILTQHFPHNFGWISDRVNSYSFDTMLIFHVLERMQNLKSVASVVYGQVSKRTDYLEPMLSASMQVGEFDSLDKAESWMKESLKLDLT